MQGSEPAFFRDASEARGSKAAGANGDDSRDAVARQLDELETLLARVIACGHPDAGSYAWRFFLTVINDLSKGAKA